MYLAEKLLIISLAASLIGMFLGLAFGLWGAADERYELRRDRQKVRRLLEILEERERGQNSEKDC